MTNKRVFFSFHYQDVVDFRANVVRNHRTTKFSNAGYFDASIWETAKRTSDIALKRLINSELVNTSVTAVLIGTQTYARRWVRYEITRSMYKGNKLLGIHINNILGKNGRKKSLGPNPFDFLGIMYSTDGRTLYLYEAKNGQWHTYRDLNAYQIKQVPPKHRGKFYRLSQLYPTYDWILNDGYNQFPRWL